MEGVSLIGQVPLLSTLPLTVALLLCLILAIHLSVLPRRSRLDASHLSFGGRRSASERSNTVDC